MINRKHSLVVVAGGMRPETVRLQPWRYLYEIAYQLHARGWETTIITDGQQDNNHFSNIQSVPVIQLKSVHNFIWKANHDLENAIQQMQPSVVVLNVGLTSMIHQKRVSCQEGIVIGVFTSPLYSFKELWKVGIGRLFQGHQLSGIHMIGKMLPKTLLRSISRRYFHLDGWVTQTETVLNILQEYGLVTEPSKVLPPGVDVIWKNAGKLPVQQTRDLLGYTTDDTVVVYFGSPAPLRGSVRLVQAFDKAVKKVPALRLLILSRMQEGELRRESEQLSGAIARSTAKEKIQVVDGFLELEELVAHIGAVDIAALPFELVPSDAPLSILEAAAVGKPVVTTRTACLPELASHGTHFLAEAGDTSSLVNALVKAAEFIQTTPGLKIPLPARGWDDVGEDWISYVEGL